MRDPAWLRRVQRAMTLWIWALLIPVALNVVRFVTPWVWTFLWTRMYASPSHLVYEIIGARLVGLFAALLAWTAAFVLTCVNPATIDSGPRWTLRRLIRLLVLAEMALWALHMSLSYRPLEAPEGIGVASATLGVVTGAAFSLGMIAYLRDLCRRLPNRKLDRRLVIVFWGFAAYWVSDLFRTCAPWVLTEPGFEALYVARWVLLGGYFMLCLMSLILFLVFSVWLVIILRRFRWELREMIIVPV